MIETARLILRPFALVDCEPYHRVITHPAVQLPGSAAMTAEDAWHRVQRYAGHWALLGYGNFAIVERTGGEYVGETGIWNARRNIGHGFDDSDEAGWVIAADRQGRGYATEAARAAHEWYAGAIGAKRTVCMIDPQNGASIAIAERLGYRRYGVADYKDQRLALFERRPV